LRPMNSDKPDIDRLASAKDIDKLVESLTHADNSVRYRAAGALGRLGAEANAAVPALTDALEHWDSMTRAAAAGALGSIGISARDAVPALERLLTDPDPVVKMCAASALRDICPGSGDAFQGLSEMLNQRTRPRPKGILQSLGESLSTEVDPSLFLINPFF
jgi:HEAT repeat protein